MERPNAHLYETGGMRRVHLRCHANILKRLLVHACAFNLSLLMRTLTGIGTPRSLQGRVAAALTLDLTFGGRLANRVAAWRSRWGDPSPFFATDCRHVQPAVAA